MQHNSPPLPVYLPGNPEPANLLPGDLTASFDWSDLLDFELDETLNISYPIPEPVPGPGHGSGTAENQSSVDLGRIRKRDPRLLCSNFLAGRIPCACPELDEKLEAEEAEEARALPGKKRARVVRVSPIHCQVPGCEADITELKGYHKRHRVCLQCANASAVAIDGETKRYCQQCGKFHLLPDFDEGKRSCRRKLERHNNRRRRKPSDAKGGKEKNSQHTICTDDVSGDDNPEKGDKCPSSQIEERETLLDPDGCVSALCSAQGSQNQKVDSFASFAPAGEIQIDGKKQNPEYKCSQSYHENKNTFTSMCPAGRISFKLYDWNPAEFPRRLRHQIFQWLASMPIELEGYIRPGCTILTAFIAMPKLTWLKLLEEPASSIKDLVASPGNMLSGRGTMLVYLNDMIFRVTKDANSVEKVKVKDQSPKLHYIYPTCFEAGRAMEFVACGTDLLQPKFRFLVSFAGRYLAYNICVSSPCCPGDSGSFKHQVMKITIPETDMNVFGPAFIEVENESGLSNFVPILIGDKETCAEMEILQQKLDSSLSSQEQEQSPTSSSCEVLAVRQAQFSDFVLDVAWSLKRPVSEQQLTSSHVQRFNYLLNFLIEEESTVILKRVSCFLKSAIDNNLVAGVSDADMRSLQKNMKIAQSLLDQELQQKDFTVMPIMDGGGHCSQSSQKDNGLVVPATNEDMQEKTKNMVWSTESSLSPDAGAITPLLQGEVLMNVNLRTRPHKLCARFFSRTFLTSRPFIMAIATIGVCLGICSVVVHPQRVGQIATTIRRCLFDSSDSS